MDPWLRGHTSLVETGVQIPASMLGGSQPSATLGPGDLTPSSNLHRHLYMCTNPTHTHTI